MVLGLLGLACVGLITAWAARRYRSGAQVPAHQYDLQASKLGEWKAIGGNWQATDGVITNDSYERGAKLLTGSTAWRNYTVSTDLSFAGSNADMGVIVRSNDEKEGTDAYSGYYIGIRTLDDTFVIGRSDFGWSEARPVHVPGGVSPNVWYRMRVTVYRCKIGASVQNLTTLQTAWIAMEDTHCVGAGRFGVRSLNSGMWKNINIRSAAAADYEQIRVRAATVEQLEVSPGPAWWTPWHVAVLFGGTLLLALSVQLIYFRVRQWKVSTITRERERLAHDIHDTMAQGFAGIGYQIQGIRHNLLRNGCLDSQEITAQLSVAYQLVRRCHEEASRTIAMLGSAAAPSQENLLKNLKDTARKLAGDQIRIIVDLQGDPIPLNLRLVDALLHIGGEAIVNAVAHSDLTVLMITLAYIGNSVELSIEDNGRGFNYPGTAGYGILGMQKRARDIGSALQVKSGQQNGTLVRVAARVQRVTLLPRLAGPLHRWLHRRRLRPETH